MCRVCEWELRSRVAHKLLAPARYKPHGRNASGGGGGGGALWYRKALYVLKLWNLISGFRPFCSTGTKLLLSISLLMVLIYVSYINKKTNNKAI